MSYPTEWHCHTKHNPSYMTKWRGLMYIQYAKKRFVRLCKVTFRTVCFFVFFFKKCQFLRHRQTPSPQGFPSSWRLQFCQPTHLQPRCISTQYLFLTLSFKKIIHVDFTLTQKKFQKKFKIKISAASRYHTMLQCPESPGIHT